MEMKRILALGVILLFIGVAVAPSIVVKTYLKKKIKKLKESRPMERRITIG